MFTQPVTRKPPDSLSASERTIAFDNSISVVFVLSAVFFCRVSDKQPFIQDIASRHAFSIIGNGDLIILETNVNKICVSIERVLDQLRNGYKVVGN